MAQKSSRYRELERFLTVVLYIDLVFFLTYLLMAGLGIAALKILCAVVAILISAYSLWTLYCSRELTRSRSLWLTCAFSSITLCIIVSLLCGFPAP